MSQARPSVSDSGAPNFFKLSPSRICSLVLFSAYSLAILIIFMLPFSGLAKTALAVLLVAALAYYLRRDAWLSLSASPVALRIEGINITLLTRAGSEVQGQILGDSVVTPVLTILNVLPQGKKRTRSVVIFPDSMDTERFRKLRVLLKWGG